MIYDVAVVGMGAMGAAALYQLAKRGASVIGIDRHRPPHIFGSTHGESRITRQAIGEGSAYVPLALRSHEIWRELEAATGASLFEAVGCLVISGAVSRAEFHGGAFFEQTLATAVEYGIAHEALSAGQVRERFPQFNVGDGDKAYFEPGGGYVRPEPCIELQLHLAARMGAATHTFTDVLTIEQRGEVVEVTTVAGVVQARRAIVAAGARAPKLLGPPFETLLQPTRQVMHWFEIEPVGTDWAEGPVYIWLHGSARDDSFYGFPEIDGAGAIKVADEFYGASVDPDAVDREVPEGDSLRMFEAHLAGHLNGVLPRRRQAITCLYTRAPGSRFIVDEHPAADRITAVSACSGHGFKHSAALGEAVAKRVLGEPETLLAPFRLT